MPITLTFHLFGLTFTLRIKSKTATSAKVMVFKKPNP